jgi:2-succinyl-6-hydroxy-2,4-cyclohexadiene-1-carboxylate synthase
VAALHAVVEGAGPRIVLVHGFTQTQACWGPVGDDLASDHEVVRLDAPGHGGSSGVRADLPGGADLIADAGGPATYVGYSMGGRFLLHLAVARPDVVGGLVVIGATGGIDDPGERTRRRRSDEELAASLEGDGLERFLDRWLAQPLFAGLTPEVQFRPERLCNTVDGLASSLRLAGTGTQEPLWGELHRIEAPVLVVTGERDRRFTQLGHRLVEAVGANAELASIPGAGHTAHLERPEAFLAVLRTWLGRAER